MSENKNIAKTNKPATLGGKVFMNKLIGWHNIIIRLKA